jgi:hypothetical protein
MEFKIQKNETGLDVEYCEDINHTEKKKIQIELNKKQNNVTTTSTTIFGL